jgi:hypothetical protein
MRPCKYCEKVVDASEAYCHGCKTVVCDECDVSCGTTPWGGHSPDAHRTPPEGETW